MSKQVIVNGTLYTTISEACKAYGISYRAVLNRVHHLNWGLEKAIITPTNSHTRPVLFEGTLYKSLRELSKEYDVDYNILLKRLSAGWSLEEAITAPVHSRCGNYKGVRTYVRGVYYDSIRKAAESHNIRPNTVYTRLRCGWSVEEAILTPLTPLHKHTRIIISK